MNSDTLLHRQVNPKHYDPYEEGMIAADVFIPRLKRDDGFLSVHNGDEISAEDAYLHFISIPRCESKGTVSISVGECQDTERKTGWELPVRDDPHPGNPHHAVIDFNRIPTKEDWDIVAEILKEYAGKRPWSHGPVPD